MLIRLSALVFFCWLFSSTAFAKSQLIVTSNFNNSLSAKYLRRYLRIRGTQMLLRSSHTNAIYMKQLPNNIIHFRKAKNQRSFRLPKRRQSPAVKARSILLFFDQFLELLYLQTSTPLSVPPPSKKKRARRKKSHKKEAVRKVKFKEKKSHKRVTSKKKIKQKPPKKPALPRNIKSKPRKAKIKAPLSPKKNKKPRKPPLKNAKTPRLKSTNTEQILTRIYLQSRSWFDFELLSIGLELNYSYHWTNPFTTSIEGADLAVDLGLYNNLFVNFSLSIAFSEELSHVGASVLIGYVPFRVQDFRLRVEVGGRLGTFWSSQAESFYRLGAGVTLATRVDWNFHPAWSIFFKFATVITPELSARSPKTQAITIESLHLLHSLGLHFRL